MTRQPPIQFRLTKEDLAALRAAAGGVSVNEAAKAIVLDYLHGKKLPEKPEAEELPEPEHRKLGRLPTHQELTEIGWKTAEGMHAVREYRPDWLDWPAIGEEGVRV